MFATSQPVKIVVNRRPEMSDAEFADQEVSRFLGTYVLRIPVCTPVD